MSQGYQKKIDISLRVSVPDITFPDYEENSEIYVVFWQLGSSVRVIGKYGSYREALDKAVDYEVEFKRQVRIVRFKMVVQTL